jgi:hypothetical protein
MATSNIFEEDQNTITIGGLTSELTANTDYALYLWGIGDGVGQEATFAFGGDTITVSATADPDSATADNFLAKFTFNTGAIVSDTQEIGWYAGSDESGTDFAGFNGFAIVAIPEPATLGLISATGGALLFLRRISLI